MDDKDKLRYMIDALVDDNSEQAEVDFHQYLEDKMKEVIHPVEDDINQDAE